MLSPPLIYRRASGRVGLARGSGRNGHTGKNPDRSRNVAAGTRTRVPDVARFLRLHALTLNLHCRSRYQSGFLADRWPRGDAGRGGGRGAASEEVDVEDELEPRAVLEAVLPPPQPSLYQRHTRRSAVRPPVPRPRHTFSVAGVAQGRRLLCCCTRCCKASHTVTCQLRCWPSAPGAVYPPRCVDGHLHSSRLITINNHLLETPQQC